jgi:ribosome-binding factor A
VVAPALADVSAVMAALREDSRRLRSEVAAAITRKRAPELAFVPATAPGGPDD